MAQIISNNPVIWGIRIFREKNPTGGLIALGIDFVANDRVSDNRFDFVRCQGGNAVADVGR
jgi:hypothetical protein